MVRETIISIAPYSDFDADATGKGEYQQRVLTTLAANPLLLEDFLSREKLITPAAVDLVRLALPRIGAPTFCYGPSSAIKIDIGEKSVSLGEVAQPSSVTAQLERGGISLSEQLLRISDVRGVAYGHFQLPTGPSANFETDRIGTVRFDSIGPQGFAPNFHRIRTARVNLERHARTGRPRVGEFDPTDFRFLQPSLRYEQVTRAVFVGIRDVSVIDGITQRAHIRTSLAWLVDVLRNSGYQQVATIFILNHGVSDSVDEQGFFAEKHAMKVTKATGYRTALDIFNRYKDADRFLLHISDGEEASTNDTAECLLLVRELSQKGRFGYAVPVNWTPPFLTRIRELNLDIAPGVMDSRGATATLLKKFLKVEKL